MRIAAQMRLLSLAEDHNLAKANSVGVLQPKHAESPELAGQKSGTDTKYSRRNDRREASRAAPLVIHNEWVEAQGLAARGALGGEARLIPGFARQVQARRLIRAELGGSGDAPDDV